MSYNCWTNRNEIKEYEIVKRDFRSDPYGDDFFFDKNSRKYTMRDVLVGYDRLRFDYCTDDGKLHEYVTLEDLANETEQRFIGKYYVVNMPIPDDMDYNYSDNCDSDYSRFKDVLKSRVSYEIEEDYGISEISIREWEYAVLKVQVEIINGELIYKNK